MGLPSFSTTDQGTNKVMQHYECCIVVRTYGIQHCLTTVYHPQANGLNKLYNQTLMNAVANSPSKIDYTGMKSCLKSICL